MTQEQSPGPIEEECLNLAPTPVSNPLDGKHKVLRVLFDAHSEDLHPSGQP